MIEKLHGLFEFQPQFYRGGAARFHLALLYDLVARRKPKSIVMLGFGDGESFFTLCQAAQEQHIDCSCTAIRRERTDQTAVDEIAWQESKDYGASSYGKFARFLSCSPSECARRFEEGTVDLLFLEECDRVTEIRVELAIWESRLAPDGLLIVHGVAPEEMDGPRDSWREWTGSRRTAEFPEGLGLGIAMPSHTAIAHDPLLEQLFAQRNGSVGLIELYRLAATRIEAQARANEAVRAQAELKVLLIDRQKAQEVMEDQARAMAELEKRFAELLTDRTKAQEIMEAQAVQMKELQAFRADLESLRRDRSKAQLVMETQAEQLRNFEALRRDRAKAQLVMDSQDEQLRHWTAETEKLYAEREQLKAEIKKQKRIAISAKKTCRNSGRCFHLAVGPKEHRSVGEKVVRETKRILRKLGASPSPPHVPVLAKVGVVLPRAEPADRYADWIREHEPGETMLDEQRRASRKLLVRPKISLLVPIYNTPAGFLREMFASVSAQTYDHWELCLVDGGSDRPETLAAIRDWRAREPKISFERLEKNLGISENTNRALALATGDFIALADHDDLLAPFALCEIARAVGSFPEADIFYSDEDRCTVAGKRHAPFFKPEWSPALLCSSMYIGHLTAYRRSLIDKIGGFRKEFDLAQDYDFALRATEQARQIHHIPHILYHWREHAASGSIGGKPDARKTNLAALGDAMRRRNLPAEIIEYPTANRARLRVSRWPRVSIIVPTDSPTRGQTCIRDLSRRTDYPNLEIVLVTNRKLVEALGFLEAQNATVRLVRYDKPFNFSDKCNVGAAAASGERLIFFNDDVETAQADWIQNLIEPLENPEVGAVAPKLLYENGKIQHAGLVMGVRELAGTAFHQRAADSTEHFNLAQSMRDVAALSAACLAMRRDDFLRLGGFDAVNTPIAHSDIDLCFKIREAGMRCVYTPYATLTHTGHASIAVQKNGAHPRDKASLYLLKRWPRETTHDPYFTDNMRDWLHVDSPTPIRMAAQSRSGSVGSSPDLLFVSHDLSLSGAPMMLFYAAQWCQKHGAFVAVMAPKGGPLAARFEKAGMPVIIDPLVETGHKSFARFARDFDCVVANTILSGAAVHATKDEGVPVIWWIHEAESVGEYYIRKDAKLRAALSLADALFAPSAQTATAYGQFNDRPARCLRNAIPDLGIREEKKNEREARPLRFLLLASVEPRKGQDIFVEALALLPRELQEAAQFQIAGRILDPDFWPKIETVAKTVKNFSVLGALNHEEAIEMMRGADVIVSASRDEAMPTVTILEAMSLGKAIIATEVGGAREVLIDGRNALLVRPEAPGALAAAIRRLIEDPRLVGELGNNARATYEKDFTIERFGGEFLTLIEEVMAPPASRGRAIEFARTGPRSRSLALERERD